MSAQECLTLERSHLEFARWALLTEGAAIYQDLAKTHFCRGRLFSPEELLLEELLDNLGEDLVGPRHQLSPSFPSIVIVLDCTIGPGLHVGHWGLSWVNLREPLNKQE